MTDSIDGRLQELFQAERQARAIHDKLAAESPEALLDVLGKAITAATGETSEEEASLKLTRVARLLGELEGPRAVDLLIDVLASDHAEARGEAGEQLEGIAFERFKEVAVGIERALTRLPAGSIALAELPYVIAEIPEPGVMTLLGSFLKHAEADAVAAAIEVIVEIGDPAMIGKLAPLKDDKRGVDIADEETEGTTNEVTVGELASEAIEILSQGGEEDDA